ncbi:MAG TPA: 50S ribosomal protein L25/general stress protein Ctc [Bacillota bacterium]|nr:50S ribosomal protein L25/general stress protein Ctc [Bacillota bacterium]
MMAVKLKVKQRENLKSSATKALRNAGQIPAVVYGKDKDSTPIYVDSLDLIRTVREEGENAIISLDIEDGKTVDVMLYDYQMHPIKDEVIHADFYVVDMTEEMDVEVSVRLEGEAEGAREGGILQQPVYELQVRAVPRAIPEEIVVDVSALNIGDTITVADLPVEEEYTILDEVDTAIATVLPPEEEEEEVADVDLSIEPEVIGAEDEDEEVVEED